MFYFTIKRIIDVILSIILLILFLPVILVVAGAIRGTSKGPILADTPPRVGKDGKFFKLYKFRSMVQNAHKLLTTDPSFSKLYKEYKKTSYKVIGSDPRVTNVGHFIRKYSIDEIPQLVNVLKGEMSLIGPRPYYPDELKTQQKKFPGSQKFVKQTLKVKPGVTGLWQVSGRSEINFDKRIEMDANYAATKSLFLDIKILLKTPWAMLSGKGAV